MTLLDYEEKLATEVAADYGHYGCWCDPTRAYCGAVERQTFQPNAMKIADCVVCVDIWENLGACPHCGLSPKWYRGRP